MTLIHIKRIPRPEPKTGESRDLYAVPAVAIVTPQGKKLIPNPAGLEAEVFDTLEAAEDAIRRAGFDYSFEGKKTYTLGKNQPEPSGPYFYADPLSASVPILIDRLRDRESSVVANAAFALGVLEAREAVEPLVGILGHEDGAVRKNVAEAMARLGQGALPMLKAAYQKALTSPDKNAAYVRLTVMSAYLELAQTQRELAPQFLSQALEGLQDENWLVRAQAALVIGHSAAHARGAE